MTGLPTITLDPATLDQLAEDVGAEALPALLASFRDEIDRQMNAAAEAVAARDCNTLERAAHSLKSTAGTFGGLDLQSAMLRLEMSARAAAGSGKMDTAEAAFRDGRRIADATRLAIDLKKRA